MLKIAVVADYQPHLASHAATDAALDHAARRLDLPCSREWLATERLAAHGPQLLEPFDGLFIGPGSPYRSLEGALGAIRFAREAGRPLIATCGGFQHVVIEYARTVLGLADAQHEEYDPSAPRLLITALPCSLAGRTLLVDIVPGSLARRAYGRPRVEERYHCAFGLSASYRSDLERAGLLITGVEAGEEQSYGEARIVELPAHPFFLATLFVPQMRSTATSPHPLIEAFVRAAADFAMARPAQGATERSA